MTCHLRPFSPHTLPPLPSSPSPAANPSISPLALHPFLHVPANTLLLSVPAAYRSFPPLSPHSVYAGDMPLAAPADYLPLSAPFSEPFLPCSSLSMSKICLYPFLFPFRVPADNPSPCNPVSVPVTAPSLPLSIPSLRPCYRSSLPAQLDESSLYP